MLPTERQSGAKIEVTPEMISAGVTELANYGMRDGELDLIVENVFREMIHLWKGQALVLFSN
jgi:hypothetical protein